MTVHTSRDLRPLACALALFASCGAYAAEGELAPDAVNQPAATSGAAGMLRAQVLLDRAHFSPGEIDAAGGGNTRAAIAAYQRSRELEPSGELDDATWSALNADAAPVLTTYTLTAADVAGPFQAMPDDMMEKAKRDALGYASIEEALGERFHASPQLLQRLNPDKPFAAGSELVVPNVATAAPLPKPAKIVVDKSDSSVLLVGEGDEVLARFPASTGSEHDPLPVGDWTIKAVARDPTFHYNPELFWDADPAHAKAKLAPGPNNPVGTVWIDLSKDHYGIHGTPEPSKVGKTESHGCIRMTNWSANLVAQLVAPGTAAVLRE